MKLSNIESEMQKIEENSQRKCLPYTISDINYDGYHFYAFQVKGEVVAALRKLGYAVSVEKAKQILTVRETFYLTITW